MTETSPPSYSPLYQQIKTLLVKRLASNEWSPGSALPSEIKLATAYGVSQGTIRKALTEMGKEHLVKRRQGRGTFAAQHSQERALFQFFHLVGANDERHLPDSHVISSQRGSTTSDECQALELGSGMAVVRIKRVRYLNDEAVITESLTVPSDVFPGLEEQPADRLPNTLYSFYESEYGVVIAHASERLRAIAATPLEAELLGVAAGSPLLAVERRALDLNNRPVEWRISHCNTEHYHYFNELD